MLKPFSIGAFSNRPGYAPTMSVMDITPEYIKDEWVYKLNNHDVDSITIDVILSFLRSNDYKTTYFVLDYGDNDKPQEQTATPTIYFLDVDTSEFKAVIAISGKDTPVISKGGLYPDVYIRRLLESIGIEVKAVELKSFKEVPS